MAKQRIRVAGRDAVLVAAIAAASGVLASVAGLQPTGSGAVDGVLVFAATAFVVWAAASAPWWASVVAAAVATAFAPSAMWFAIGLVPLLGGLAIGTMRRSLPWSRALTAGIAIQVFAHLGDRVFFGFTSLLGVVTLTALAVLGVRRRPRVERRRLWIVVGAAAGTLLVALFGFALAGSSARPEIEDGNRAARDGLTQLAAGEVDAATASFSRAAEQFAAADKDLGRLWAQPARLIPVVSQYRRSADTLVNAAALGTAQIAQQLSLIDYDSLRVVDGRIDIAAVEGLAAPVAALKATLVELIGDVESARDPWLIDSFDRRLVELLADMSVRLPDIENIETTLAQAPAMLGRDDPRVYFIAFTTPAEARGLGGFMGNFAEITIDDGQIAVTNFGRTADLRDAGPTEKFLKSPSAEFKDLYGPALYKDSANGITHADAWFNITASPDFPSVAGAIAELYPQSGGTELDGVFAMDVFALATLMEITGPVGLSDGTALDASNAAQYLLRDQYLVEDNATRIDDLELVARQAVQTLLTSALPSPPDLGQLFSTMIEQRRMVAWSARPDEEQVFELAKMTGTLPDPAGGDGFAFAFNNGSASKIDVFLEATASYDVTIDREAGWVGATATLVVRNEAPSSGLPQYVIGNTVGLPTGTNRTQVMLFTALPVEAFAVDGLATGFTSGSQEGYFVTTAFIDVPPGGETEIALNASGAIDPAAAYRVVTQAPAAAHPMSIDITIEAGLKPSVDPL